MPKTHRTRGSDAWAGFGWRVDGDAVRVGGGRWKAALAGDAATGSLGSPGPAQDFGTGTRILSPTWSRLGSLIVGLAALSAAMLIPKCLARAVRLSPEWIR
jgi:hypothetical protein